MALPFPIVAILLLLAFYCLWKFISWRSHQDPDPCPACGSTDLFEMYPVTRCNRCGHEIG